MQELINRVVNILVKPIDEWKKIMGETWTIKDLFIKYALILAAIPVVAGFIGNAVIGQSMFGTTIRYPIGNAVLWMVLQYVFSLGAVFLVALIMDALAPTFGANKDLLTSLKVVIFSWTATWVGGVFLLIPVLSPLAVLVGIYSLVLLYFGMKGIRKVPEDKLIGHYVMTLVCAILLFFLVGIVVNKIALQSTGASAASAAMEAMRGMPR